MTQIKNNAFKKKLQRKFETTKPKYFSATSVLSAMVIEFDCFPYINDVISHKISIIYHFHTGNIFIYQHTLFNSSSAFPLKVLT